MGYDSPHLLSEEVLEPMKHIVSHDLGQEKAKKVAEAALRSYGEKFSEYAPTANWVSDTEASLGFNVKGFALKGGIVVRANEFELTLEVPFMLKPFQGKAIGVIEGEMRQWIDKAKAGAL
jgi:hypothetical protein